MLRPRLGTNERLTGGSCAFTENSHVAWDCLCLWPTSLLLMIRTDLLTVHDAKPQTTQSVCPATPAAQSLQSAYAACVRSTPVEADKSATSPNPRPHVLHRGRPHPGPPPASFLRPTNVPPPPRKAHHHTPGATRHTAPELHLPPLHHTRQLAHEPRRAVPHPLRVLWPGAHGARDRLPP